MGIALHRKIDDYTDSHPATRQAKEISKKNRRTLFGCPLWILYMIISWQTISFEFEEGALADFAHNTYLQLGPFSK